MPRGCIAAFWGTVGSPPAQVTQDKALSSIRTTPLECPATPTPPFWFNKGQMIRTWALLGHPQGSRAGPREAPTLQSCRAPAAPHLPKPRLLLPSPSSADESRELTVLRGTSHLFIHWRGCSRPLILFSKRPMQASPLILPSQNPVSKTCLEYIYYNLFSSNNKTFSSRSLSRGDGRREGELL